MGLFKLVRDGAGVLLSRRDDAEIRDGLASFDAQHLHRRGQYPVRTPAPLSGRVSVAEGDDVRIGPEVLRPPRSVLPVQRSTRARLACRWLGGGPLDESVKSRLSTSNSHKPRL